MDKFLLTPQQRLKKGKEFDLLRKRGKKLYCKNFVVVVADIGLKLSRLGLTVSKKVDKRAVKRNHVKRRVREVFRLNSNKLRQAFDIVVIARQNAQHCSYQEIERQIIGCLRYHGYLRV